MKESPTPSDLERAVTILLAAANTAGVKFTKVVARTKNRKVVAARMMTAELLSRELKWGHRRTAKFFQQCPTDVLRGKRRLRQLLETSPTHQALFEQVQRRLYGPTPEQNDPEPL